MALTASLLTCALATGKPAKPGSLDGSFGHKGHVTSGFPDSSSGAQAVAVDSKGRTVAVGVTTVTSSMTEYILIERFTRSGKLDKSFAGDGQITASISDPVPGYDFDDASATGVAIDSKGRIVVSGTATLGSDNDFFVTRYEANGTLDHSFGDSGVQTTGFSSSSDFASALAIDRDGTIVVAGTTLSPDRSIAVARYTPNGQLDQSFDGDGKQETPFLDPSSGGPSAVGLAIDAKHRVVVAGTYSHSANSSGELFRFKRDGSPDGSLAGTGYKSVDLAGPPKVVGSFINSLCIDDSGRYVVAGTVDQTGTPEGGAVVARLMPSGKLDHTFAQDGRAIFNEPTDSSAVDAILDRKHVVVLSDSYGYFRLHRFTVDGRLDKKFKSAKQGFAEKPDDSYGAALTLAPGHRYLVAGEDGSKGKLALARFLG